MSGVATITAHTPTISIDSTESSAMILSRMTTYGRADASSGVLAAVKKDEDENEGDKDDLVESSDKNYQRLTIEKEAAGTKSENITTRSHHQRQQPGKGPKLQYKNCSQSRPSFINQTSAIRRTEPWDGHDGSSTTAASSSSSMMNNNNNDHQQFQQQEEFNKMRERLFRLLSKVPIQVESSREVNCWGDDLTVVGPNTQHTAYCSREPLIIKYYNERYLNEILDLHFNCSLRKQQGNYEDGRLAIHSNKTPSCKEEGGARSVLGGPVRQQFTANCQSNQLTPAHCSNGTTTPVHKLAYEQQQALEYQQLDQHHHNHHHHHHQQLSATYSEWQQPTGSGFSNFQWQPCGGNPMEAKPGSCTSDPTASTSRRPGGSSSSNSSSSSLRGSSVAVAPSSSSVVMKDTIHKGPHSGAARKLPSCNGRAVAGGLTPAKSARQRRQTKHQVNYATSRLAGGGGSHGGSQCTSSPPSTTSSSRTDITSPIVGGTPIATIYPGQAQQQQQHSNRKQAKYCQLSGGGPDLSLTDRSPGSYRNNTGATFANVHPQHQLSIVGGAFSQSSGIMSSTDHSHNYNNPHPHHHHHHHQQTDPNQNIHLHLYAQHQSPYHHHHQHLHQQQQQQTIADQTLTTMAGSSPSQAHFNLQPAIDQHQEPMASIIPFRPAHYHPVLQTTTTNHDDGHANGGQQQLTVYGGGGVPLEHEQPLQHHHQHQHDNSAMTTALQLAHEQLPVSVEGVQYYTSSHPAQISLAPGTRGNSNKSPYHQLFHQHHEQPCSADSANNNWRSQLFQMDLIDERQPPPPHQQMIEQQQHTTNNMNHNYGTREERSFRMGPSSSCASNYSVLYANGSRQQAGVIELQLDMTLNGSQ